MNVIDQTLFAAINAGSETWGMTAWVAYVAARYIVMLIPLHLMILWILGNQGIRRQALVLAFALTLAVIASFTIGAIMPTQRPFVIPIGNQLLEHRQSPSFPSNHGLVMFTYAATMMALGHWRRGVVIASAAILVAWSRVYLGIHFPFDMAGALVVAIGATWVAMVVDKDFGRKATQAVEAVYGTIVVKPACQVLRRWR